MDPFREFHKNTDKAKKTIEQIALSDYDYFRNFLIKDAFLLRFEEKHAVNLTEKLAELYLDLNDFNPLKSCDCGDAASLVKFSREGDYLSGGFESVCPEHTEEYGSSEVTTSILPILLNSRYSIQGKKDRKKFDKYLLSAIGLADTRSAKKVSDAIGSLEHVLSEEIRNDAKGILVDYMAMAPSQRNTDEFKNRIKERVYEMASDENIYRLSWIFSPIVQQGVQIMCHEFKRDRDNLKREFGELVDNTSDESQERAAIMFYESSPAIREYLNTWFGYDKDQPGYETFEKMDDHFRAFIE